jgi:hypothetical protein
VPYQLGPHSFIDTALAKSSCGEVDLDRHRLSELLKK